MLETVKQILFPNKVIVKALTQDYNGHKERKTKLAVKNIKFKDETIPLIDEHASNLPLGEVTNFKYINGSWNADILFSKDRLSDSQLNQLRNKSKKDVSIGFTYKPVESNDGVIDQTDILIDHVAWTQHGRCSSDLGCGLDSNLKYDIVNIMEQNLDMFLHKVPSMSECDEKIKAMDSTIADSNVKYDELKQQYDSVLQELDVYRNAEISQLKGFIIGKSKYDMDSLKDKNLSELNQIKEILGFDSFPEGEEKEIVEVIYNPRAKVNDLFALYKKSDK